MREQIKLGDLLVKHGLITQEQLKKALEEQKKKAQKIGNILIQMKFVTEDQIQEVLSQQLYLPSLRLSHFDMKPEIIKLLPEKIARRYQVAVIDDLGESYLVGMTDPSDLIVRDEIGRLLKKKIRFGVVKEAELLAWINKGYRRIEEITDLAVELNQTLTEHAEGQTLDALEEDTETPVMKILEGIFKDAVAMNASDIHIEPDKTVLRIRQRVDGVLVEHKMNEISIAPALVLRLKLLAKLNISEKRLPQDGRFHLVINDKQLDVRLSTLPIQYGESVVMRLLQSSAGSLELDKIGMPDEMLKKLKFIISRPHGVVLVTGPTGSGKTTTLYSCLAELNKESKKIITVEDPVEYSLTRVNQVQINAKIDLTFARVLRAVLRQDPDVIMVGEMRDTETASIGLRAAITGHLVFSTLHTNDAVQTATRLVDMGIEPFLVASALRAIIAQRLVRKICPECVAEYHPTEEEYELLEKIGAERVREMQFKKGKGCQNCAKIGYKGRIGAYELLELDNDCLQALRKGDTAEFTHYARKSKGYRPLVLAAYDRAIEGLSTIEEVIRLVGEVEEE